METQKSQKTEKRSEVAIQFEDIYEKHNSVEERERRKLQKNRDERSARNKEDLGL